MLRSVNELRSYVLYAEDGEIGECKDFLFDDQKWAIRYMVADTRKWLPGRKVLISPIALGEPDWLTHRFPVKMTKEQIKESPPLDEDAPVSRQYEKVWFDFYGWPYYWTGESLWGFDSYPTEVYTKAREELEKEKPVPEETHLRSEKEVRGYHIKSRDGEIGHLEDLIVDDESWALRYMVVDTRNWLPGRKVLVSTGWIKAVSWLDREVEVDVTQEEVKNSPKYDPSTPINREYEVVLYDYYGRPHYWEKD